ncbi:MAG: helix-turn-helix transcriptional regulator, partial [Candidatus Sericytochromatia bacterium]
RSMEPLIPDGSLCVFKPLPAGSRQGKIVLAQHRDLSDVDHDGGSYTVKRYRSVKRQTEDGWEHESVSLEPLNRDYSSLEVESTEENPVRVVAEFVMVLPERTTTVPASKGYSTLNGGRAE